MSYLEDLKKLKRAAARHGEKQRRRLHDYACCVCGARPAPETRFGPRCEKHEPAPDPRGGE